MAADTAARLAADSPAPAGTAVAVAPADERNAVQKICALLRALGAPAPLRLSQLSAMTGLNKVTALRILDTLVRESFAVRAGNGRGYGLGPEMLALSAALPRASDLREVARPSLITLAALSEDTVLLSTRSGVEAVCSDRQIGSFPIRANYLDIGSRRPLGVGAGSLALLAWLPDREIEAILAALSARLTEYPRCDAAAIRRGIGTARERGYVVVLDSIVDRMGAVGAPIWDKRGAVVGALSVAALSERVRDREAILGAALMREAGLIRQALAGPPPAAAGEPGEGCAP